MTFIDRAIGIDLGTTNSEVAMLEPAERELLVYEDRFKRRTIPSALAWDPAQEAFVVGRAARARRGQAHPPIESIKRKMGRQERVSCGPVELWPEEIAAKILAGVKANMAELVAQRTQAGVEVRVDRAVITVPAYFDAPQVEATRRAGELAGLDPIGILQEPTAAAIFYTWKHQLSGGNFLIYDFGGGTFDVSVLRCVGGEYQVLAIEGDNYLGGDDLDRRFAEHLRRELTARGYALDLDVLGREADRRRFDRLVHLAQELKESLSVSEVVPIAKQDLLADDDGEPVQLEAEIGREDFEKVVGDLIETTIDACHRALEQSRDKASVGLEDIDHVLLVGGSTRVPLVRRRVTEALVAKSRAERPLQDEVDTCVAYGAAIHAAQLGGLRLGSCKQHTQVLFTTPLVSKKSSLRLGIRVEKAPDGATALTIERAGQAVARTALGGGDKVLRLEVPLGEERTQPFQLAFQDDAGQPLGALDLELYRGDVRPRASALSRPAVIAKDIALEIVRAGRRDRRVLLFRGTGLPMTARQSFFTADQSGVVVLRLLQGRLPIKTLVIEVPRELPVGTAVDLSVSCDEAMRMEAHANVAGQQLWATIEPPEPAKVDPQGGLEALLEQAEQVRRSLWGYRGEAFRREADTLTAGIREVLSTDPDKLHVLCTRLQLLLADFSADPAEGLAPPLHHFEWELDDLRRIVYRVPGTLLGLDRQAWEKRVSEIEQRAQEAYEAADAAAWRRICNEVQALRETARQEEFAAMRLDDPAYIQRRLAGVVHHANRVERGLLDFVPSASDEVRHMQLGERERLLAILRDKVTDPLRALEVGDEDTGNAAVRRQIEQAAAELERLDVALERLPSLGLVTERGGTPPR